MSASSVRALPHSEMCQEIKEVARRQLATDGANLSLRAVARVVLLLVDIAAAGAEQQVPLPSAVPGSVRADLRRLIDQRPADPRFGRQEPPAACFGSGFPEFRSRCTVRRVVMVASHADVLARFGHALSDPTRSRILLALRDGAAYPAELAETLGVSRTKMSNHLACLRGCGLVVAVPEGRRTRYELAEPRLAHALGDLLGVVLAVDPRACQAAAAENCC